MTIARITLLVLSFASAGSLLAQQGGQDGGTTANQVPLTGRGNTSSSVTVQQSAVAGTTQSVNTINADLSVQGPFAQSVLVKDVPVGPLGLHDAIRLGLEANLGMLDQRFAAGQAHAQMRQARSTLLPNLSGSFKEVDQESNLTALGLRSGVIPGVQLPQVVGPYNYFDLRATLKQTLLDFTAVGNLRSAQATHQATQFAMEDAQDTVVLAVAGSYLQLLAAQARVDAQRAQVATAKETFEQTSQRQAEGLNPKLDSSRSQVSLRTEQQRLTTLENDLVKQKLNFERIVGLPVNEDLVLAEYAPYAPAPGMTFEEAVRSAEEKRADLRQARAAVQAAERARNAARAEHLPSASFSGDYGEIGVNPAQAKSTYTLSGTVHIPIFAGGRIGADIELANAALRQRQAELAELQARIRSELKSTYLDMRAASDQFNVAAENQRVARENLLLTRERFDAGVTDSVEVTQAEQSVATADLDTISGLLAFNLAKISVARQTGNAMHLDEWLPTVPVSPGAGR